MSTTLKIVIPTGSNCLSADGAPCRFLKYEAVSNNDNIKRKPMCDIYKQELAFNILGLSASIAKAQTCLDSSETS